MTYLPDRQIQGTNDAGAAVNLGASADGALRTYLHDGTYVQEAPRSFQPVRRLAVSSADGVSSDLIETSNSGAGSSVAYSTTTRTYNVNNGTDVGGYAEILSKQYVRALPGATSVAEFGAMFGAGVASGSQIAGPYSSGSAAVFGRDGTDFGVMHRTAGRLEIQTLTVTVGTAGAETLTVTLNGVAAVVAVPVIVTTAQVAAAIAELGTFPGWEVYATDSTVVFIATSASVMAGAFTLTSTGTADGTFAQNVAGVATVNVWIAQASWNLDVMDGTGASGYTLVPEDINSYRVSWVWTEGIVWSVFANGEWVPVHRLAFVSATITMQDPTMRVGWAAFSLGSTTNLEVQGTYMTAYVDTWGSQSDGGNLPFCAISEAVIASHATDEQHVLTVRNGALNGGGDLNRKQFRLKALTVTIDGNRAGRVYVRVNGELVATSVYTFVDNGAGSVADICTDAETVGGGRLVAGSGLQFDVPLVRDIDDLNITLDRGDTISIGVVVPAGTVSLCVGTLTWDEV